MITDWVSEPDGFGDVSNGSSPVPGKVLPPNTVKTDDVALLVWVVVPSGHSKVIVAVLNRDCVEAGVVITLIWNVTVTTSLGLIVPISAITVRLAFPSILAVPWVVVGLVTRR